MSDTTPDRDTDERLAERVSELEDRIERLEQQLDTDESSRADQSPGAPDESTSSSGGFSLPDTDWLGAEDDVDRFGVGLVMVLGVALLLMGLAFLFRWAIKHDLWTPLATVGFGMAVATVLAAAGWRVRRTRHRLGQVLLGAGSVGYYISLFAAHQIYGLIPEVLGFAAMTGVVLGTFVLANSERDPALAVIGAIGGFATPVLLGSGENIPVLMVYTAVLVVGMTAIYVARGWRHLLGVTAVGGWAFVSYAAIGDLEPVQRWYIQATLLVVWLSVGVVPACRSWIRARAVDEPDELPTRLAGLLVFASAVAGFALTQMLWDGLSWLWMSTSATLAAAAALGAAVLSRRLSGPLVSSHRITTAVFVLIALFELLPADHFVPTVAAVVVAVQWTAATHRDRPLAMTGHLLALPVLGWLHYRVLTIEPDSVFPVLNSEGLEAIFVVGCLFALSSIIARNTDTGSELYARLERLGSHYGAHAAMLAYIYAESVAFGWDNVNVAVSIGWSLYATVLLVAGVAANHFRVKRAGLIVVVITAGKLILVDLQAIDLAWRVLLFMGFGTALVLISYFWPRLAGSGDGETDEGSEPTVES